jgi:hypothetical protein
MALHGTDSDMPTNGTTVKPTFSTDNPSAALDEFTLHTDISDVDECACPGCSNTTDDEDDDLSITAGADMEGMLADYGTIDFCSLACAREFRKLGTLRDIDDGRTLIYFPSDAVVAHVHLANKAVVFRALGCNFEQASEKATEWLSEANDELLDVDEPDAIESYSLTFERL